MEKLVLGHPINMDGTRGPRSEKAQAMKQLLEEATGLPVVLWDERRTTIDAHQILMSSGKNAKKRKKVVDAVAASLILEGYLTYLKTPSRRDDGRRPRTRSVSGAVCDSPGSFRRLLRWDGCRRGGHQQSGRSAAPAGRRRRSARKTPWESCRPPSGARTGINSMPGRLEEHRGPEAHGRAHDAHRQGRAGQDGRRWATPWAAASRAARRAARGSPTKCAGHEAEGKHTAAAPAGRSGIPAFVRPPIPQACVVQLHGQHHEEGHQQAEEHFLSSCFWHDDRYTPCF